MQPGKQLRFSKFFVGLEEKLEDKEKESAPKRRKIDEDTYKEIFDLLLPGCGTKAARKMKKLPTSKLKKDCSSVPWCFIYAVVVSLVIVFVDSVVSVVFKNKLKHSTR